MAKDLETRFWNKLNKLGKNDCWLWPGAKSMDGYGRIKENGRILRAHRVAYELSTGPIPEDKVVCHSCDVRACCNPAHLWLGTKADNNADAKKKGRAFEDFHHKGEKHPQTILGDVEREEIKKYREKGVSYREIGKIYNVSHVTVYKVLNEEYREKSNYQRS